MADIEARREARRRRILENSENRLKKISGVEAKTTKSELDGIRLNTSYENENESLRLLTSDVVVSEHDDTDSLLNNVSSNSLEVETIFRNPRSVANDSVSNCYVDIGEPRNYRTVFIFLIPIVLSVILVLAELFKIDLRPYYFNKIFVPLIIYEIITYFYYPFVDTSNSFFSSVLLLVNISSPYLPNFMVHFQYITNIVQDVMIYFFAFTVSYWILQVILI